MVKFQKFFLFVIIIQICSFSALAQKWFQKGDHLCAARTVREKPLLNAIKKGDELLVEKLLQRGGNPNLTDDCGIPIIDYAADMLRPDLIKTLIKSGANVNAIDDRPGFHNEPPLLWLIDSFSIQLPLSDSGDTDKFYDSVKLLIENGANVNLHGEGSNDSALISAVKIRQSRLVELLIDAGAEINFQDDGRTAYSYAAQIGEKDIKRILVLAGADTTTGVEEYQKEYGENAFFQAAADGRTDVVEAMITLGTDVNLANEAGKMTALMRATEESTVDSLIAAGADLNLKDKTGHTALIWAVLFRRSGIVKKLIAAGADVNLRNNDGKSALDLVSDLGLVFDPKIKAILIKAGAK
jgi:ankyrin repeat protein